MNRFITFSALLAACAPTDPEALPEAVESVPASEERVEDPVEEPVDERLPESMTSVEGVEHDGVRPLHVWFAYLTDLGDDYVYEGWLIVNGEAVSAGRFASQGDETYVVFDLPAGAVADASLYVLTIEPAVGDDPAPSDTHVLAGAFEANGIATTTVAHGAALGDDFATATGGYILETPSTASIADDYFQGIWFLNPAAGPGAGLDLPELPAGWTYEGWLLYDGYAISTGSFLSTTGADSDAGGPYAGPDGTPPFPGQDFINPAVDLYGFRVAVTVEPVPDNSPGPYGIVPLQDGRVDDLGAGVFEAMTNTSWYVPSGAVAR